MLAAPPPRLWPPLVEILWVFMGVLAGWLVMVGASKLGLIPGFDSAGGLLYGPAAILLGGLLYRMVPLRGPRAPLRVEGSASGVGRALALVLVHVLAAVVGSLVLGELMGLLGSPVEEQATIREITDAAQAGQWTSKVVLLGVSALVAAPAAEEWLFRGLLLRRLCEHGGRRTAYVLSAASFAAVHGNPSGLAIYLWLGLCFASVYLRTGRLWCAMLVHAGNNVVALAVLLS